MSSDPLDTTDHEVPIDAGEVAAALRELADGDDDYMGRLLAVAALYVEAFAMTPDAADRNRMAQAKQLARPSVQ